MKYFVSATPGPMPPPPELFDAAMAWLQAKQDDGTFDCVYGYVDGGGFSIANASSHSEVFRLMADFPLYGLSEWTVQPLLAFGEEQATVRAKLVEAQAAMGGG
jgi:hypothetical protein